MYRRPWFGAAMLACGVLQMVGVLHRRGAGFPGAVVLAAAAVLAIVGVTVQKAHRDTLLIVASAFGVSTLGLPPVVQGLVFAVAGVWLIERSIGPSATPTGRRPLALWALAVTTVAVALILFWI